MGLFVILAGGLAVQLQGQEIDEYHVKAAFLFNFAKFITWPQTNPALSQSKLEICVAGSGRVAEALRAVTNGKSIDSHQVAIRELNSTDGLETCQMLFVGSQERKANELLLEAKKFPLVTVGENEKFLHRGGIINFVLEDDKLRFEINIDAASHAGLTISSKLLSLAKIVRDKS
jgi:hypothetical protein